MFFPVRGIPIIMITLERLRELLEYDPETGIFRWKVSRGNAKMQSVAETLHPKGYLDIRIDGKTYKAHRLAWFISQEEWPKAEIDHHDGIPSNNRILNLREATSSENGCNTKTRKDNTSGHKGISWCRARNLWMAGIQHHKTRIEKPFILLSEAVAWMKVTREQMHKKFTNHG